MVLTSMGKLWNLYKLHEELYLSLLENGSIAKRKLQIKPEKEVLIKAKKDHARPIILNEEGKVVYIFKVNLTKGEGYRLKLSSKEREY